MKTPRTLILTRRQIETLIDMKTAISAVEAAFQEYALGQAQMPPKVYLGLPDQQGDLRAMPAYLKGVQSCGIKWVNSHPLNRRLGLPTVMAVFILNDPQTGFPLSIMDATHLTALRTAAASAVATQHLARRDAQIVSLIGCGIQAQYQIQALREVMTVRGVKVWGFQKGEAQKFQQQMRRPGEAWTICSTLEECVQEAEVIVTSTPSRKPLVKLSWLKKGAHINAIGADAPGKQELDLQILKQAKIVVDDWQQASHAGEINVAWHKKVLSHRDIYGTLGEVVAGKKRGRVSPSELTVFDSTGLAIQDVAVAKKVYEKALRRKQGRFVKFF